MDKLTSYRTAIREIVREIADMTPSDDRSETQLIIDDAGGHYILLSVGWQGILREYLPFVHIDLRPDGKVWLQHDGTDLKIALQLADKGVAKKDIVLAFQSPERRKLLPEFAAG